ncbi:MAG: type VI secretion system tip protein TssI/VgrG [Pseudomonadota bacterium]
MAAILERLRSFTQKNRSISVSTTLGDDTFLLRSFSGKDTLSCLFEYQIELLSNKGDIGPTDVIGEQFVIVINGDTPRYFSGYVRSFTRLAQLAQGFYSYKAVLVPWFWFLTQRSDCRVFQQKTVMEIVEEVMTHLGFRDFAFNLVGNYPKIEYCVQYNETDFDFINRLLEHEGIYYYFSHIKGQHKLVFCDHKTTHTYLEPKELEHSSGSRASEKIFDWEHRHQYFPGKWVQSDFDFEKFSGSLLTERETISPFKNAKAYELYHYPGDYKNTTDGNRLATVRMEKEELKSDIIHARSSYAHVEIGKLFTLLSDEMDSDNKKKFLVTEILHHVVEGSYLENDTNVPYSNKFTCISESLNFRPPLITPKPKIDGVQTALVVGAQGDEICTDKYGRIKIQFPWDRYGKRNDASSCWVRVASQQAGNKWGVVGIPRVGNEVVVTFIEGDPDRPLVIGSVFNNENMPPITLPAGKNQTGMKSQSTGGAAGQNGFCVDDTKGNEAMNIHSSYNCNFTVDNDLSTAVVNNATYSVDVNLSETVGADHSLSVVANQKISVGADQTESVTGNQNLTVAGNQTESITGDQTISAQNQTVTIKADQNIETNNQNLTVKADHMIHAGAQTIEVKGKQAFNVADHATTASGKIELKATEINLSADSKITFSVGAASITIEASKIELVCGPSSVKVDMAGVTAMGPKITLN